jgi:hypothetical protein
MQPERKSRRLQSSNQNHAEPDSAPNAIGHSCFSVSALWTSPALTMRLCALLIGSRNLERVLLFEVIEPSFPVQEAFLLHSSDHDARCYPDRICEAHDFSFGFGKRA